MNILKGIIELVADAAPWLVVLSVFIEIAPIKINPWSRIAKWLGKTINGDVVKKLNAIEEAQKTAHDALDEHIRVDDERNADLHRIYILRFNRELLQGSIPHTMEDFVEILSEIDFYERYCKEHDEYENNRAVLAINNIKRAYAEALENNSFGRVGKPEFEPADMAKVKQFLS